MFKKNQKTETLFKAGKFRKRSYADHLLRDYERFREMLQMSSIMKESYTYSQILAISIS